MITINKIEITNEGKYTRFYTVSHRNAVRGSILVSRDAKELIFEMGSRIPEPDGYMAGKTSGVVGNAKACKVYQILKEMNLLDAKDRLVCDVKIDCGKITSSFVITVLRGRNTTGTGYNGEEPMQTETGKGLNKFLQEAKILSNYKNEEKLNKKDDKKKISLNSEDIVVRKVSVERCSLPERTKLVKFLPNERAKGIEGVLYVSKDKSAIFIPKGSVINNPRRLASSPRIGGLLVSWVEQTDPNRKNSGLKKHLLCYDDISQYLDRHGVLQYNIKLTGELTPSFIVSLFSGTNRAGRNEKGIGEYFKTEDGVGLMEFFHDNKEEIFGVIFFKLEK